MKVPILIVCFGIFALGLTQTLQAQDQLASSSPAAAAGGASGPEAKLSGRVRRLRVEAVKLLVKEGKTVEGPRVVREITTYDQTGQKVDSVAYAPEDSTAVGKKHYLYDPKGNIIEMVSRGDDGSILGKEKYDYQFDEFGNWKKMTASIAVYENGSVGYEPFEILYRTITYYYSQPAPKIIPAPTVTSTSNTSTAADAGGNAKIDKPTSESPLSIGPTGTAASDLKTSNPARAIVVKPEKSEPSITAPAAVTTKDDAPVSVAATGTGISDVKPTNPAEAIVVKPEKSEPSITAPAAVTTKDNAPVSVAATGTGTSDVKPSNAAEAVVVKPEKSEPSIPAPAVMTSKEVASPPPVIRMSEDALRKAAIDLPQPKYPEAAVPTGAEGNVEVQILVDEKGEVVNASALSGNPLFSEVAMGAARKAKFSRAKLSQDPGRVYGVINYTFSLPSDQSAAPPAANVTSRELKTSQSSQGISDSKILQPDDSSKVDPKPATDPAPAVSFYAQGLGFLASGRNSEAVVALRQAVERDPNDADAYAKLGIAYAALGQHREAVVVLKMAIRIKPEVGDAETYYQLSNAYTALGKSPQALEAIKQAMYIKRAEQANPVDKAASTSRFPSLADLHYATGLAYYDLQRYREAIEELKQVLVLKPKLVQAYYGLALSYIAHGDRKSAEKQQAALESLDPVYAAKVAKLLASSRNAHQGFVPRKSLVF